jgi:hypothetical protein
LDYVLFGDSDLLPLNGAIYQTDRNWHRNLHIINAFCCGSFDNIHRKIVDEGSASSSYNLIERDPRILHIAMCHAGATVSVWNDIFSMNVSDQWDESRLEKYVENLIYQVGFKSFDSGKCESFIILHLTSMKLLCHYYYYS